MADTLDPLLGRLIAGKLEILKLLGAGSMGRVYRAHHVGLDKPVAIKVLLNPGGPQDGQARRFQAEARAASRLDHPHSVQILDFGEDPDGLLYIAMEYLEGSDLQAVLHDHERLPWVRVAFIMSQVFSALGAAHQKGVVHRDMKPGNVMLIEKVADEGRVRDYVKVCDFGLAKILDDDPDRPPLTRQGAIFGTPAYMSPEQARGAPVDGRSDIYACGIIMFKALSGRTPFRAESPTAVLMQHIQDPPPELRPLAPGLDGRMEAIVERCLAKDPNDRFQDARALRDELRDLLRGQGLEPPTATGVGSAIELSLSASAPERPAPDRAPTAAKTSSMRPPTDLAPDEVATTLAHPAVRAPSAVQTVGPSPADLDATRPPPTIPPPTLMLPPTPLLPPTQAPGASGSLAAIPGVIALLALGGLVAFLVMRGQSAAPTIPLRGTEAVARVAPSAPVEAAPLPPETEGSPSSSPTPAAVAEPPSGPSGAPSIRPSPAVVPSPSPTPESTGVAAPRVAAGAQALTAAPTPPGPKGPLELRLEALTVMGGLSKHRVSDGLGRGLDRAQACVVQAAAPGSEGQLKVTADIDERGRLRSLSAAGDLAIEACLQKAFVTAKLPIPDTGTGRVSFVLHYLPRGE